MGLLERLQGKHGVKLGALELPEHGRMAVHGESHYQPALQKTARTATEQEGERTFRAILVPEPNNPYDENAVMVYSQAGLLGYLPRDDAADYQPVFSDIRRQGCRAGVCTGQLTGGTSGKPFYGVVLHLATPNACLQELQRPD